MDEWLGFYLQKMNGWMGSWLNRKERERDSRGHLLSFLFRLFNNSNFSVSIAGCVSGTRMKPCLLEDPHKAECKLILAPTREPHPHAHDLCCAPHAPACSQPSPVSLLSNQSHFKSSHTQPCEEAQRLVFSLLLL